MAIIRKSKDQIKMGGAGTAIRNYRGPYFATWSEFFDVRYFCPKMLNYPPVFKIILIFN